MQKLPDGYRMVLSLYLLEGYDHGEIGDFGNNGVDIKVSIQWGEKEIKGVN